jgi:hypothetical protein
LGDIGDFPASLAVFNHAIAHIPKLDIWLDGTAEHSGVTEFPFGDQNASALRLASDKARFVRTPVMDASQNRQSAVVEILLDPDGDAQIKVKAEVTGEGAAYFRRDLATERTRRERFESSLASTFPGARLGEMEFKSLESVTNPVAYNYTAFVPGFSKVSKDELHIPIDMGLFLSSRFNRLAERKHDLVLGSPKISTRDVLLEIPANHEIVTVPATTIIESPFGLLRLEIHEEGNKIRVSRRFELHTHRVAPANYAEFVAFCHDVDDALMGRVVLRRKK